MYREVFPKWCQSPAGSPGLQSRRIDIWRILLVAPEIGATAALDVAGSTGPCASAHEAMRSILSRYAGIPASELPIVVSPGGKPRLDTSDLQLEFNLSHSRDMALLAVAASCTVGIDVETCREIADPMRIARRALSEEECAELASLPDGERMAPFLSFWTRMEARQKAIGRGVFAQPADSGQLSSFGFRPGPHQYACLSISPPDSNPVLRFFDYHRP